MVSVLTLGVAWALTGASGNGNHFYGNHFYENHLYGVLQSAFTAFVVIL